MSFWVVGCLIVGLIAQVLGVILVVVDVRHDRLLARQYQESLLEVERTERDNAERVPSGDITEDLRKLAKPLGAHLDAIAEDIRLRNIGPRIPSWVGVVLLVVGIAANFAASISQV